MLHTLLSASGRGDILPTYELHVNCDMTKPLDLERFFSVVESLESFWLTVVKLPKAE